MSITEEHCTNEETKKKKTIQQKKLFLNNLYGKNSISINSCYKNIALLKYLWVNESGFIYVDTDVIYDDISIIPINGTKSHDKT